MNAKISHSAKFASPNNWLARIKQKIKLSVCKPLQNRVNNCLVRISEFASQRATLNNLLLRMPKSKRHWERLRKFVKFVCLNNWLVRKFKNFKYSSGKARKPKTRLTAPPPPTSC